MIGLHLDPGVVADCGGWFYQLRVHCRRVHSLKQPLHGAELARKRSGPLQVIRAYDLFSALRLRVLYSGRSDALVGSMGSIPAGPTLIHPRTYVRS